MKHVFKIFALCLISQIGIAQDFGNSNDYQVTITKTDKENLASVPAHLSTIDSGNDILAAFEVDAASNIDSIKIKVLEKTGLESISQVIKVDVIYVEFCKYTISHYFMLTTKNEIISLPKLSNSVCEKEVEETVYHFPSQVYGEHSKIVTSQVFYTNYNEIHGVTATNSFAWNDDASIRL
ncbi:hypothetical protein ULMS_05560 [Patiriisocius marinistellae]|uniref:Uncharacterized protein n=1 Tax=Patiriisocius marinistellae TaxID=2494560 RepID=A0A5J4FV29_9FLAO|nr:hypothetical protein [Patiriisocius marinistellae]GEQ85048.1 hypothetical protein ULMS_05560 [Patiriisocius marinistellae]